MVTGWRGVRHILLALLVLPAVACGGSSRGHSDGGGGDGGSPCGFSSTEYLPYQVGNSWSYQVTDLSTGQRDTKNQVLESEMTDPTYGDVIVQHTTKPGGQTVGYLRPESGQVLRFYQEDRDAGGALQQTTVYDPFELRIDETPEHLAQGASWDVSFTETVTDPQGALIRTMNVTDHWEVLGVDVACESPLGSFTCIRLHKVRAVGGVSDKEYFFAHGVGKVREVGGNQVEELTACGPQ